MRVSLFLYLNSLFYGAVMEIFTKGIYGNIYYNINERQSFCIKCDYCRENISMKKVRNNFMKSTGVVRRVDDLGRIVIPKEIRRTLRIRDGESLEIFVDREMIALKKFSKMSDMNEVAQELVEIINATINKTVLITDRDKFIAGAGGLKKKYIDTNISRYLEGVMKERKNIFETSEIGRAHGLNSSHVAISYAVFCLKKKKQKEQKKKKT